MQPAPRPGPQARVVGRYAVYGEIAAGGMATVHYGRLVGDVGFSRTVAIKRLHPQFAKDPEFVSMFLDEARLAARIQHPNVVTTLDIVPWEDELFLVMEYVHGEALSKLIRAARRRRELMPPRVAASIVAGTLHGLHAAHEAKSERGEPLNLVHRDVSPQNVLVGTDGSARVLDFGVAKAAMRSQSTRDGQMKGKVSYMAPEQLRGRGVDRRTDVFAAGVVLWEALTGRRLFDGQDPGEVLGKLLDEPIPMPTELEPAVPREFDQLLARALCRDPAGRYGSAREFAIAIERSVPIALNREVGEWVEDVGGDTLSLRAGQVAEIESISTVSAVSPMPVADRPSVGSGIAPLGAVARGEIVTSPSHISSPSQPTSMSASHDFPALAPAPRRGLYAALVGIAAALAIALGLLLVLFISKRGARTDTAVAAPPSPAQIADTAPEPAASALSPALDSTAAAPSADEPVEEPPVAVEPTATAKPPPRPVIRPATRPATKPKEAGDNCSPPTYVDKNGIHRIKPGCL
jgi:eukaryotic-like serine/threonine-protein kinase